MTIEILCADLRLRRVTIAVLALALLAALALVFAFHAWMSGLAARLPAEVFILQLRHGIGFALIACGLCLLLLAGYAARMARRVRTERRWPLGNARVLRDTPIVRDQAAARIGRLLDAAALVLILFGVAAAVLSWRLFAATHY
jgi:hypothetical protein